MPDHARAAAVILALGAACATVPPAGHEAHVTGTVHWFDGSVEAGFALARKEGKPIFLYWGAVWCPPCNEIKSVVFTSPEVGELMRSVVPIYLDGDTARAQLWADKLHVSGYPSMLVLDSTGKEQLRLSESVELAEFMSAVSAAILPNYSGRDSMRDIAIDRALSGGCATLTREHWMMLACASWDEPRSGDAGWHMYNGTAPSPMELWTRFSIVRATPGCPVSDQPLRAAFIGKLLEDAAQVQPADPLASSIRAVAGGLLGDVLASPESVFAARSTIVSSGAAIIDWLWPDAASESRRNAAANWVAAADSIRRNPAASADTRLLADAPQVELWSLLHPGVPLSGDVTRAVQRDAHDATAVATSRFERHAIVSDAAELLELTGDVAGARALLAGEIGTTDTPWYYQSSLARLELRHHDYAAALGWSAKARESARGDATRLQWLVSDLLLNAEVDDPSRPSRVAGLLQRYYDLAFQLPDGFVGRNGVRARTVAAAAAQWTWPEAATVISRNRPRCARVECRIAFPPE